MIKKNLIIGIVFLSISFSLSSAQEDKNNKNENALIMDLVEIKGQIDKPQIVYVINLLIPPLQDISLERSFLNDIKQEKIDKLIIFDVDKKLKP